jgi:hypothetical protein
MISLLDAALGYAAANLPVFALQPRGKKPVTPCGFYDATTNPATIRRLWRIPDRNIGVPTGVASGFWVIDIDPGGEDGIERLQDKYGPLPPTRTLITPRGGWHHGSATPARCRTPRARSRRTSTCGEPAATWSWRRP